MEKIGSAGDIDHRRRLAKEKKREEAGRVTPRVFHSILSEERLETAGSPEIGFSAGAGNVPLETLLDAVHGEGERLKERPTMENIRRYKETVRNFLSYVIQNSLETETVEGARYNPLKKQKKYTLIKVIDRKLENLAAHILLNQREQLDLLRKVDEIYGLVIDLLS